MTGVTRTGSFAVCAAPDDRWGKTTMAEEKDLEAETAGAELRLDEAEEESTAYELTLPTFHGPLDLLLHLIRKHEVDIYDIPIVLITEQYNTYLDAMEELDLEVAADFIYLAAVLIHIKSKMLLPRDESAETAEEDPRQELVNRLLEYQRFKSVAETFAELDVVRMGVWARRPAAPADGEVADIDMSEVSLFDLIDAFRGALNRFKINHPQAIELQRTVHKVSDKMRELYDTVAQRQAVRLVWYLENRGRDELIAIFLGMLELVRLGGISLQQSENFGDIVVARTEQTIDTAQFTLFDNS